MGCRTIYAHINFSDPNNFRKALHSVVAGLRDPELPVCIDSVFALRSFVESCKDLNEIRPILPQLLDEFFKLMNEVENEDLVFTLETVVDKFGEEMAPYALGLCQNLAAAFWKCTNNAEADDEADDPGALAAVGCLRAISTILDEIQLKSPNWLFGQRKYEESNCAPKVASQETANGRCQDEKRVDGLCDLKWLSFSGDVNEKDVFKRGFGLVGEEGNQKAYHPGGRRVESHEGQTSQTLGPLKVGLIINFRVPGLVEDVIKVSLESSVIPRVQLAEGLLISVNSLCEIDGVLIGPEFCKVFVLKANKPNAVLETTSRCLRTVGEAVGRYIVWRSIHV